MALRLDEFITAVSGAVVEAQHQVRQAHIGQIWSFFRDGSPIEVNLKIPRYTPGVPMDQGKQMADVSVPLLSLVNPSQLAIQQMQVTMQVDMSEVAALAAPATAPEKAAVIKPPLTEAAQFAWKPEEYRPAIQASTTTGKQPGQVGLAQVTLTVAAEEVPEGLARLLDHLNKCL